MPYDPLDPESDVFGPPVIPTQVGCLHCGQEYESYLIEWRVETTAAGQAHGFWCCPTPGCGGKGFGCDILPTDPTYQDERGGWVWTDEADELEAELEDLDDKAAAADEEFGDELPADPAADADEDLPY